MANNRSVSSGTSKINYELKTAVEEYKAERSLRGEPCSEQYLKENKDRKSIYAFDNKRNFLGGISFGPCCIGELYVTPKRQNQGIGTTLFKKALQDMSHCKEVCWAATPNSVRFYQARGAEIDDRYAAYPEELGNNKLMCIKKPFLFK